MTTEGRHMAGMAQADTKRRVVSSRMALSYLGASPFGEAELLTQDPNLPGAEDVLDEVDADGPGWPIGPGSKDVPEFLTGPRARLTELFRVGRISAEFLKGVRALHFAGRWQLPRPRSRRLRCS